MSGFSIWPTLMFVFVNPGTVFRPSTSLKTLLICRNPYLSRKERLPLTFVATCELFDVFTADDAEISRKMFGVTRIVKRSLGYQKRLIYVRVMSKELKPSLPGPG